MSNLITTIISIALIAVAAVMGIFYGGTAYENAQINAYASTIISGSQQLLLAERLWSENNGQPDISSMSNPSYVASGVTQFNNWTTPNSGFSALIAGGELTGPPEWGNLLASPLSSLAGFSSSSVQSGQIIAGCYNIAGYQGSLWISPFAFREGNYITYSIAINVPYVAPCYAPNGTYASSTTDISQINHPMVQIAKAINKSLNQIPSNADFSLMPYIGLPAPPVGSFGVGGVTLDSNGNVQTNYCFVAVNSQYIGCIFGPS